MGEKQLSLSKASQAFGVENIPSITDTEEDRRRMVAEAAYYHAEHRGFQGGDINDDWYRAEAEIDAMLSKMKPH